MEKIRWAIAGPGMIAGRFCEGLELVPDAVRAAVCSRQIGTARRFAEHWGFASAYDDFGTMLAEARPDIVYIAVPNDIHIGYVLQALDAGVHVLCEKPMADNLPQLQQMLARAAARDRFLMEGMWTRCFPAVRQAREWIARGEIGKVLNVRAFFDICPNRSDWQLWKAGIEHAGGALRDVGIYALAMAFAGFPDEPERVYSSFISNGEVDEHCDLMLKYANGGTSMLSASFDRVSSHVAEFVGDKGRITLGPVFWKPTTATMIREAPVSLSRAADLEGAVVFEEPYAATGFQFEIMRVQECLRQGLRESPDFTWRESESICRVIDGLRREWGIVYASDLSAYGGMEPD